MGKELECLDRIDKRNYLTEREHKEFLGVVEKALTEYEAIKNAEPTKAMECLETIWCDISTNYINEYVAIKQALLELKSIKEAEPSEALRELSIIRHLEIGFDKNGNAVTVGDCNGIEVIKQALLKAQEQEKENELLKEIIKSLFDRSCPLHQYTDKDFGLTIEVDDECSIMHLGEFKGVDLDKKLQEVLEDE